MILKMDAEARYNFDKQIQSTKDILTIIMCYYQLPPKHHHYPLSTR